MLNETSKGEMTPATIEKMTTPINLDALEKKRQRILAATADQDKPNPHLEDYRKTLIELLTVKIKSQDEFINWVTGLSTASMYLALTNLQTTHQPERFFLLISALASFAGIMTAIAFKYFSNVRFSDLELQVEINRNLAQGYDINTYITNLTNQEKPISKTDIQRFLKNMDESLSLLDPENLHAYQQPVKTKEMLMARFYRLSIILYVLGIVLLVGCYVVEYF
jgi:hypothetical protein